MLHRRQTWQLLLHAMHVAARERLHPRKYLLAFNPNQRSPVPSSRLLLFGDVGSSVDGSHQGACACSHEPPHTHTHTPRGREHEYEKTSAAMASRISIKLKHAGVTHELELDPSCECPYNRAAALLSLPKDRIKILRLGKLLPPPGSPSLRDALVAGGMYMVTGTSADAQLPSSTRRHFASAVEALSAVYASLTWVFVRSWLIWLLSMLSAAPRVGFRFVSSMVVPPARPDGGQRPPRAHAE